MRTLTIREIITIFLIMLLLTTQAYAGPLTNIVTYVQSNLVGDIEVLAIIAIGFVLFAVHTNWWLIIGICAGVYIIANASTLVTSFSGGG